MDINVIFVTAFLVGLTGAMVPGPLLSITITSVVQRGFWAGPLIVLGHGILEIFFIGLLLLGLSEFLTRSEIITLVAVMGGLFLIYLGFDIIRNVFKGKLKLPGLQDVSLGEPEKKNMHPFLAGILLSISNPFFTVWWATIGLTYLALALKAGPAGLLAFFSGHILADLAWYSTVAAAIVGGSRFISSNLYNIVLGVCGIFLAGLGFYFVYSGFTMY